MLRKPITEEQALFKLTALCSTSEHCLHEMQEKLQKWGVSSDAQDRILDYLVDEKYVDEERFCRAFIHDKIEYNGWGRRKIEQVLWMKRIDKRISTNLLNEIRSEQWIERLRPLIESKRKSIKADSDYEMRQKLMRFAIGRGFCFAEISKCFDEPIDEEYPEEDMLFD